jgi:hypothetical protein
MTTIEVKTEIQRALENAPDDFLPEVLEFIKQGAFHTAISAKRYKNFKKIIAEDDKLFERLAK